MADSGEPGGRAGDAYRVLFDHLTAGAARCRLVLKLDEVVAVEVLEANRAFEPVRAALPQLLDLFTQVHRGGMPEKRLVHHGRATLSTAVYPVRGEEVMVVIEDVTAHELLEQRSRESQVRFEQAFHGNAAAMVIAHQSDLRIIDVNPRWLEMFGATRDEVIGRTAIELGLISESNAHTRVAEHRQFTGGYDIELELRTRAGASLIVLASAKPIQIAEGPCTLTTLIDITGRKHAEQAFSVAFGASPAGMILVEVETDTVVAVNDRLLAMTQDRRENMVGHRARDLELTVSPTRSELITEIRRTGRLDGLEVQLASRTGNGTWALASTEVITLHGKLHRLSVFTDIAARKRSERRLMTQHVVGRRLAEAPELDAAVPDVLEALCHGEGWDCGAMWLIDPDDRELRRQGAWCGSTAAPDLALAAWEHGDALQSLLHRVVETSVAGKIAPTWPGNPLGTLPSAGLHYAMAFPILRGESVLGVVALAARHGSDTLEASERTLLESIGRLLGLFVERTRAETALRTLNLELVRSHDRLHALASVSDALVLVATSAQALLDKIAETTAALVGDGCMVTMLSEDGQRLVNAANAHCDPVLAHDYKTFVARMAVVASTSQSVSATVIRTGQPHRADTTPAAMVAHSEEALRPAVMRLNVHSFAVVPIRTRQAVIGTLSLVRSTPGRSYTDDDVTLLQDLADRAGLAIENARLYAQLEQRVRERTSELRAANQELEAFSYSVAHDLRAPLRAISGFSEIVAEDHAERLDADAMRHLASIRGAAHRMGDIIDDLLNLARIGRAELHRQYVDVTKLATTIADRLRVAAPERKVEIAIEPGLVAQADPHLLDIALTNLIGNAWKFTSKRTAPRIEVAAVPGEELTCVVRDNGAGFEPARAGKLFGAFQRLHSDSEFEGTGIGLAIVQRIIHRHGGRIWAEGAVGLGARFFFTLGTTVPLSA